jgi:nucleoside-diphosphate-sugar epimerase
MGKSERIFMIGITGHRGVLGSLLKERLQAVAMPYSLFNGDIRDRHALGEWLHQNRLDYIFHFAAIVPVAHVRECPFDAYAVNVGGCIHLGEAIASLPYRPHVFYASSSHVYASQDRPIKEEGPVEPLNWYGTTKLRGEEALLALSRQSGAPVCICRVFSFYSDLQKTPYLYPAIKKRLAEEDLSKPFRLMGAKSVRDMSRAEGIVDKLLFLQREQAVGVYNVGTGVGITIQEFVDSIAPQPLEYLVDEAEPITQLVADMSKYNRLLEDGNAA